MQYYDNNFTYQVDVMYRKYLEKLKSPLNSTLPARELWTEIDKETVTMGSLVCLTTYTYTRTKMKITILNYWIDHLSFSVCIHNVYTRSLHTPYT